MHNNTHGDDTGILQYKEKKKKRIYWAHFHLATNKTVLETGMCDEKKCISVAYLLPSLNFIF